MKKDVVDYIEQNRAAVNKTWDALHAIPEIGFQETKTSAYLAEELRNSGFKVTEGLAGTGVLGTLDSGKPGSNIGLRADMDALVHTNAAGESVMVHSCGHDANCTKVLWAAKAIAAKFPPTSGKFVVLFQPAEETILGAKKIIETGAVSDLEYFVSTHLRAMDELPLGLVTPAILHGASAIMEMSITGKNAHGARPHQGVNAVEAGVGIIQAVQALHFNPSVPHSAKVTKFHSGTNPFNVIPSSVSLVFDLRAQTNEVMAQLKDRITNVACAVGQAYGAQVTTKLHGAVPAATKCQELIDIAAEAIKDALGEKAVAPTLPTPGGEDFHEYAVAMPGLKSTVIGVGADLTPGLHQADMKFAPEALLNGAKALAMTIGRLFEKCTK
ncbi:MAG: amidohydrolase [Treponema sp.]|nr:amidohydrolase [Treponema sp.]